MDEDWEVLQEEISDAMARAGLDLDPGQRDDTPPGNQPPNDNPPSGGPSGGGEQ